MLTSRRRQILVDPAVQGTLILRVVYYWLFCLLTICLLVVCWYCFNGHVQSSGELFACLLTNQLPVLVASLLALPLVLVDVVRLSNRFVGPMHNLNSAMRRLADGASVKPIRFRTDDYWAEMASAFNKIAARLEENDSVNAKDPNVVLEETATI